MLESQKNQTDILGPLVRTIVRAVLAELGTQAEPEKLFSIEQAAEILAVPKRWLYERTAAGTIPFRKLGKYIRFTGEQLRQISDGVR